MACSFPLGCWIVLAQQIQLKIKNKIKHKMINQMIIYDIPILAFVHQMGMMSPIARIESAVFADENEITQIYIHIIT